MYDDRKQKQQAALVVYLVKCQWPSAPESLALSLYVFGLVWGGGQQLIIQLLDCTELVNEPLFLGLFLQCTSTAGQLVNSHLCKEKQLIRILIKLLMGGFNLLPLA